MMRIVSIVIAAGLCLANNGSCMGGGVNSASAANICAAAARAGAAADLIAQALVVGGVPAEKVAAAMPLIQAGKLLIGANCAVLVPAAPAAP